jgi:HEAT repeat protein
METETLSPQKQLAGKKRFRRFMVLNGISFAFLMENTLILYAVRNGLSDPTVAVLASFIHLTMPFMILGKRLVASRGLSSTWSLCWLLRYLSASVMIAAPLVPERLFQLRVAVILLGTFGFALFRAMGAVSMTPLLGEVTTSRDRGRFISGNFLRSHSAYLVSMILAILAIRLIDRIWAYQLIILTGCLVGLYGSRVLSTIPETSAPRESARLPALSSLRLLLGKPAYRRLLLAWCSGISMFVLFIPVSMLTVKNGYGIPDHSALMFSLVLVSGGIVSSLVNGSIADHVGPRPLLILYSSGFVLISLYWCLAPTAFLPVPVALIFLLAGFCKIGIMVCVSHYLLSLVEQDERVGVTLFVRMFSGAAAGLAGAVGSGTLLNLLQSSMAGLDVYRNYFRIVLICLVPLVFLMMRLKRLREWKVRNILGLLFSPRDLRAMFVMNRMEEASTFGEDARNVEKLGNIRSSLSEAALQEYLSSPRLSVRIRALRALRQLDFGPSTAKALRRELKRGEFTSAWIAAEILGENCVKEATGELRACLDSEDPSLRGKSMVALVQLGDEASYERIRREFAASVNPRILINGAQALASMDQPEDVRLLLEKSKDSQIPEPVVEELLSQVASLNGTEESFYTLMREYHRSRPRAVSFALASLASTVPPEERRQLSREAADAVPLKHLLATLYRLSERSEDKHLSGIRSFLKNASAESIPEQTALCLAVVLSRRDERQRPSCPVE